MLTKVILEAMTNENYLETEYTDCKKRPGNFFSQVLHNLSGDVCKNLQLL